MKANVWFRWFMIVAVTVMMTACGGGPGGNGGASPDFTYLPTTNHHYMGIYRK